MKLRTGILAVVAAAFLVLGERLALVQLAGGAVVVLGVFLATGPDSWFDPVRRLLAALA